MPRDWDTINARRHLAERYKEYRALPHSRTGRKQLRLGNLRRKALKLTIRQWLTGDF